MRSERDAIKTKIIEATIRCIEKIGFEKVTTRAVAKEAGINAASINYYFGTQENLLEETFKTALDHFFFDIKELFAVRELHCYSLLKVFFSFLLEGIQNYPRLVQTLMFSEQIAPRYRETFLRHFSSYIEELSRRIREEYPACSSVEASLRVTQMLYVILATCLPFQLSTREGCDFRDAAYKEQYLELLLSRYIDWIPPERIEAQRERVKYHLQKLFDSEKEGTK